jgi:hypothetical protein
MRIDALYGFNLITPEVNADGEVGVGQKDIDGITLHAECASLELHFSSAIKNIDQANNSLFLATVSPTFSLITFFPNSSGLPIP